MPDRYAVAVLTAALVLIALFLIYAPLAVRSDVSLARAAIERG